MARSNRNYAVPKPAQYEFDRKRLLDRIEASEPSLVLVIAPAGYGKSILLAQYAREQRLAAWVTISQEATDVHDLALSLVRSAQLKYDLAASRFYASLREGKGADRLASSLSKDVDVSGKRLTFVIDGLEKLSNDASNWLSTFVDYLDLKHRVVLAGRHDNDFMLEASRGRSIVRLSADELTFSLEETRILFGLAEKALPVEQLWQQIAGWPVALKMIASGGSADATNLITGPLTTLPLSLQKVLSDLSVLFTWSEEDASALGLELPEGWLDALSSSGLPLVLLDQAACRPHDLLRSALLEHLKGDPARYTQRQHDAAALYLNQGETISAIRAALEADDLERAVGWVREPVFRWGMRWEWTTVRDHLSAFPQQRLPPELRTYLGASLSQTGALDKGETILRGVVQEGSADALTFVSLGMGAVGRNDFSSALRCADAGLPLARAPYESVFLLQLKGLSLVGQDWDAASLAGEEALEVAKTVGHPALLLGAVMTKVYAGLGKERNDLREYSTFYQQARAELQRAVDLVRSEGYFNQMLSAVTVLAHLDFQLGESERSLHLVEEMMARAEKHPNVLPYMYMRRGDHYQAKGDFSRAVGEYERGFAVSEHLNPGVLHLFAFSLCECLRYLDQPDKARWWLDNAFRPGINDAPKTIFDLNHRYFQGVLALDEGDLDTAEQALQTFAAQATRLTDYYHRIVLAHAYLAEVARRKNRLTENHIDTLQKVSVRYQTLWALQRESRYLRPLYDDCMAHGWHSGLFALPAQQETHTLKLRTLGVPTAELDGQRLVLPPKPLGVLVYLALQGPCPADEIVKAIWEGEEQMRANVRAQIHIIRRAFAGVTQEGKAFIRHDTQNRLYELLVGVSVDALDLEKAATGSRSEKERAIQSYELPFMLALDSEWASRLRRRFHSAKDELIIKLSK